MKSLLALSLVLAVALIPLTVTAETWELPVPNLEQDNPSEFFVRSIQGEFRNNDSSEAGKPLTPDEKQRIGEIGPYEFLNEKLSGGSASQPSGNVSREISRD